MKRRNVYSQLRSYSLSISGIVLLISGCSVGPDYSPPEVHVPQQFASEQLAAISPALPVDITRWWESFNDPMLNKLIKEAVESNLDVAIATARVREARALVTLSRSGFFPNPNLESRFTRSRSSKNARQVGSSGSGTSNGSNNLTTIAGQTISLYEVGFDATWEIDVFGGVRREVEAALGSYEAQLEARRNALVTLLAEVANNYMALRGLQKRLQITERNIAAQRETLDLQKMRLDAGLANDLTVAQAQAQFEITSSQLPALEIPMRQAAHRLGVLLGKDPSALLDELLQSQPLPLTPITIPTGLPSELLLRRPDIRQADRQLASATANIGVATSDLFPKLELTGVLGLRSQSTSNLFEEGSKFWSTGPSLTWNVLNWFAIKANIEVKNALQEQALLNYKKVVLTSFEDVENGIVAFSREQLRRAKLQESFVANTKAFELAQSLNTAGIVDFLNVLSAQQGVFTSEDQLVQSEQAVATNLISLFKALGGGWEILVPRQCTPG